MYSKKFEGHEKASAKINYYDNGMITLVSYTTTVAVIDEDGWMSVNGLYSRTTIKHLSWFMRMFGFFYQTAKALYEDSKEVNIFTGEVRDKE